MASRPGAPKVLALKILEAKNQKKMIEEKRKQKKTLEESQEHLQEMQEYNAESPNTRQ